MRKFKKQIISAVAGLGLVGGLAGCSSNAGNGALIGGAAGAGLGAIIGHNSHDHTAGGAAIGGTVGALSGALIGNEMDKDQARHEHYRDDRYYDDYYSRGGDYDRPRGGDDGYWGHRRYEDSSGRYYDSYREDRYGAGY
ncbi:MAG TPA: glycine zipper domain-containing protein [Tepidisphaeraceae bacterium]